MSASLETLEAGAANPQEIETFLARAVRGQAAHWPFAYDNRAQLVEAIQYHGIGGLLTDQPELLGEWPRAVSKSLRAHSVARAIWELRHKAVLAPVLGRLNADGIAAFLLKGTAMAYDLYPNPAARERSDTDLLVAPADRKLARALLRDAGFSPHSVAESLPDDLRAQENWLLEAADGTRHSIDLHWQVMNYPAFNRLISFDDLARGARALPRIDDAAFAPARPILLLHACLHRQAHIRAPYYVNGTAYFGGDRLIWLNDIALLSTALTDSEWQHFCGFAIDRGLAQPCLDGIAQAQAIVGSSVPATVRADLARYPRFQRTYFQSGPLRRALSDIQAIPGGQRKWRYVTARLMPNEQFMRAKYPGLAHKSLARLYLRRVVDFIRPGQRTND